MITPMIGEILESSLKGTVYEVIRILDQMVILQSLDGSTQILTSKENLNLFYQRVGNVGARLEVNKTVKRVQAKLNNLKKRGEL